MKKVVIICLIFCLYSGQDINPQARPTEKEKVVSSNIELNDIDPTLESRKKMDSIMKSTENVVNELNKHIDVINKNKGFIENNEKKIQKKLEQEGIDEPYFLVNDDLMYYDSIKFQLVDY